MTTASRRAADLHLPNVRFVQGDIATLAFEEPFDAVVGRCVLEWCPDPSAVLRQLAAQVRPGGVIAFQEPDWYGYHTHPLCRPGTAARAGLLQVERPGADPYLGVKLYATFTSAGLPPPALAVHATIAAGPDHPLYEHAANLVRSLLPTMEEEGIATAEEVDVDTLPARLHDEAAAGGGTVIWISLIGAATRKPRE